MAIMHRAVVEAMAIVVQVVEVAVVITAEGTPEATTIIKVAAAIKEEGMITAKESEPNRKIR
jgi:hypothetical protein